MTNTLNLQPQAHSFGSQPSLFDGAGALRDLAASIEQQLEQAARASGYPSYAEMQRCLESEVESLEKSRRSALLKELVPIHDDISQHASNRQLPAVDAAGLVAIADMVKSVARLIRILLLGYSEDEVEELRGRMKAERALEVDSAMSLSRAVDSHDAAIGQLNDLSRQTPQKIAP